MATRAAAYNAPRLPFGLIIMLAAAAAGLILGVHATKHTMADVVRNCPDDNIAMKLVNPITGRMAIICEYEPEQFGRIITEEGREVTAYASEKRASLNTLEHVIRNMHNSGYNVVRYVKPGLVDRIAEILARMMVP